MTYTIRSAAFANAEQTAAVLHTEEAGAVLVSEADTPELWGEMLEALGGSVLPYSAPAPPVPQEVTMRQARLALAEAGLLPAVDAAIAGMTEPQRTAALIEWEYSGTVQRDKPLVLALASSLGLTEAQLDELFSRAATL